mmetsp:Transcript_11321/g.28669  ORF Transcript_11321/g.28669 Transcript_11321/m.28669 type:complete len:104 (-) Transcript_11321:1794-2105(-)
MSVMSVSGSTLFAAHLRPISTPTRTEIATSNTIATLNTDHTSTVALSSGKVLGVKEMTRTPQGVGSVPLICIVRMLLLQSGALEPPGHSDASQQSSNGFELVS